MTKRELQHICSENNIPNYTKFSKNELKNTCNTIQDCTRKNSLELREMCSKKNVSHYGDMTKDEMIDWCCMDLDIAFGKMGVRDIKKYLKEHGVEGYSGVKKDDLIPWAVAVEKCSRKSVTDLKKDCRRGNVKGYSSMHKEDLINACCVPELRSGNATSERPSVSPHTKTKKTKREEPKEENYEIWASEEKMFGEEGTPNEADEWYEYEGKINGKPFKATQTYGWGQIFTLMKGI